MKYFIDFEATEHSGQIIAVGCVDESGREFYSLVKPNKTHDLTEFIKRLTGITEAEICAAPSVNDAFSSLFDWFDNTQNAEFYVYGNMDKIFVEHTIKYTSDFRAQCCLALINSSITDFSKDVRKHYSLLRDVSLKKLISFYRGEEISQTHNALEDARFLHEAYTKLQTESTTECPFPEYRIAPEQKTSIPLRSDDSSKCKIMAFGGGNVFRFPSYGKAVDKLIEANYFGGLKITNKVRSNICNNLQSTAKKKGKYCGLRWELCDELQNTNTEQDKRGL